MTKYIIDFNNRLLDKVEYIFEEGKRLDELSSAINVKSMAKDVLALLQSSIVLWAMNQNFDMKMLFETDFKYLWNTVKSEEISSTVLDNTIINISS